MMRPTPLPLNRPSTSLLGALPVLCLPDLFLHILPSLFVSCLADYRIAPIPPGLEALTTRRHCDLREAASDSSKKAFFYVFVFVTSYPLAQPSSLTIPVTALTRKGKFTRSMQIAPHRRQIAAIGLDYGADLYQFSQFSFLAHHRRMLC